jgi:ABC-type oligopeptide transport system substrate-binding subunit
MNDMRVNFMILAVFCLLAGACASQGSSSKTKMSSKYHKKEYPRNQANINSLQYDSKKKKDKNKPGFFKTLFPGKKSSYASN